jgi:hypothetical protein
VVARDGCSCFSMRLKTGVDGDCARGDDDSEAFAYEVRGQDERAISGSDAALPSV